MAPTDNQFASGSSDMLFFYFLFMLLTMYTPQTMDKQLISTQRSRQVIMRGSRDDWDTREWVGQAIPLVVPY